MSKKCKAFILVFIFMLVMSLGMSPLIFGANPTDDSSPLVTATFFESDLKEALQEVALQTKVNIVSDENVKGVITLELKNVPLEKALQMMLMGEGLSYRKVDDFYIVGLPDPKNPVFAGLCESSVYSFQNIGADSAKALLPVVYEPFVKFDLVQNVAVINAPPEISAKIVADFKKIDVAGKQIKIKALVTEVRNDVLKQWGINSLTWGDIPANYSGGASISNGAITLAGTKDGSYIFASINAMAGQQKAVIDADPVMIVTEGKTGAFFVGDRRTLILESMGTLASSTTVENVEAGTTLNVTPRLLNGQIELTITQKVSYFDDENDTDQILVRAQEFSSVVRFAPGQTVMIAGMTGKNINNQDTKTPLLGDIPIVRLLFKQKSDENTDYQLLVFITADVID